MIGRLNHVAIATKDIAAAATIYREVLGAKVSDRSKPRRHLFLVQAAVRQMKERGATITGSGEPRIGAHGKPVVFLHPKDFNGTLIELEQA